MKMMKVIFSIFLGLSILSCSKGEDSELTVEMVGETAYLINAEAQSCVNKMGVDLDPGNVSISYGISPYYFSYTGATLSWANTENTAYIVGMKLEFTGVNLSYTCTVSGEELLAVFYNPTTNTTWDGTLAKATSAAAPTTKASYCPIRCGGITVTDENNPFTSSGKVTLIGFERSPDGEEKPLKTTANVKIIYQ